MSSYSVIFPGQGSQNQTMLDSYKSNNIFNNKLEKASDILGYNIHDVIQDEGKLNNTLFTQPIIVAVSVAMWDVWSEECDEKPAYAAGHSLGEYTALVAAELISFEECLILVEERAKLMSAAMKDIEGGMAAIIGLDSSKIIEICSNISAADSVIEAVNFNSDKQTVVAGHMKVVKQASEAFKTAGAKLVKILPVSVAAHTSIMKKCSEDLYKVLKNSRIIGKGVFPILHNVDASIKEDEHDIIKALTDQVHSPVLWTQTIKNIDELGANTFIEIGPGNILTGLNKRILRESSNISLSSHDAIIEGIEAVQTS
jgi:[acyl-carrier-protein] S-malonyltransferase